MYRRVGSKIPERMQPRHKIARIPDALGGHFAHARHDPHVRHHVRAVGHLNAGLADRRIHRPHDVRHHVHGPPAHGPIEQRADLEFRGVRIHPVVRGADVVFIRRANESQVFGAGYIVGTAAVKVTIRDRSFRSGRPSRHPATFPRRSADSPLRTRRNTPLDPVW